MADLNMTVRVDIKLASATLLALDTATLEGADEAFRPHLGASQIGKPCERALWYGFRWVKKLHHEARMMRLFARGQREEAVIVALMRKAGITVHDVDHTGRQFSFKSGHFGGSMDAAAIGVPEAPATWHVCEFKTSSSKHFKTLADKGVREAKPEHWAQMQCYMEWTGITRALYIAVCKDDDRIHAERIDYDGQAAKALFEKAQRIIESINPPERLSERPDWYECKMCSYHGICHGTELPIPHCRTCAHVTPIADGQWQCERHGLVLDVQKQQEGCQSHRFIPSLLANIADAIDADTERNIIIYQHKDTGKQFANGLPPHGIESKELDQHIKAMQ